MKARVTLTATLIVSAIAVAAAWAQATAPRVYDISVLPRSASVAEAVAARDWVPLARASPALSGDWWARLRVDVGSPPSAWTLYVGERATTELYEANGSLVGKTGSGLAFRDRIPSSLVPALPLPTGYRSGDLLYVHLTGALADIKAAYLVRTEELERIEIGFWVQFILVAGVLGGLGALHLILAIRLRDAPSYAFVASCIGFIIYEAVDVRVGWALFWPNLAIPYEPAWFAALIPFLITRVVFIRTFVPLARLAPIADRLMLGSMAVLIGSAVVQIFRPYAGAVQIGWLAGALGLVAALAGVALCARQGSRSAKFALLAFAGFAPCALSTLLADQLHVIPPTWFFNHGIEIGICTEAVLLSFGLADRVRTADLERIKAQQLALDIAQKLNDAVSRFLPTEFIDHLGHTDVTQLVLGDHVERRMSVLFCDIRSFTTLSEAMSPAENFRFLNSYLSQLGPVIRESGGFIDKYIGDAIMGLFPGNADDAVSAAIALHQQLQVYNEGRMRAGYRAIACGVGLHRGDLMLGTIGESKRMDTTVIADVVNVASRLEGLTKHYHARVLVSGEVVAELKDPGRFMLRDLGLVAASGKTEATRVFEVLDADDREMQSLKAEQREFFDQGLAAFREGRFTDAFGVFSAIVTRVPNDGAAKHYMARSYTLGETLPRNWDGVDHMHEK